MSMISLSKLLVQNFIKDEEGASAVEYGLILGLIAVVIVAILVGMSTDLETLFDNAATQVGTAATESAPGP